MTDSLDVTTLTEAERVACYGAFFAMAGADGSIDDEELVQIFETLDLSGMSDEAVRRVRGFVVQPPDLTEVVSSLSQSDNDVRYGVLVHLADVALADELLDQGERRALDEAGRLLGATSEQIDAILEFLREVRGIRTAGMTEAEATARLERAGQRLQKSGVPLSAVLFSGSVAGLTGAGLGAALAAGLGLAIGTALAPALALGGATFLAMSWALGRRHGRTARPGSPKQSQLLLENLQAAIHALAEHLEHLDDMPAPSAREAAERNQQRKDLNHRMLALQRLLARKRAEASR